MAKKTPITAAPELDTEVANRLRDPFELNYLGVLRTNDPLLLERGSNGSAAYDAYRDLKRDGKVFSGLQKRKLAVISRPWQVEPVVDTPKGKQDAQAVSDILKALNFDQVCSDLLDALLMGWAPMEIVWTVRDGLVVPARVVKRAQRRFVYQQVDEHAAPELRLLTKANMLTGEQLPEHKFIVHQVNAEDDNPYGTGLGLQLYWPVFFKRKGIIAWNKLNDRFGSPTPWGKYPRGAGLKEKGTLFDALRAMSNDGVLMTPEGMSIELLESKLTGSVNTQQSLCEYMDDWIMEVILGQAPRTKGGGALAAASSEREGVRTELSQADSDLMSGTINSTLLAWICEYNGFEPCQVSRVIKRDEDLKAASEADVNVSGMGFKMTLEGVRGKYGEHWEEATPAIGVTTGKPADNANFSEATAAQPDALDALIDTEQAQWKPVLEPMVDPIRKLLADAAARGETAAELLARLPQLLAEMDADPLAESLARTAFVARLAANAGIENA
jgi:phage gp29-like protein